MPRECASILETRPKGAPGRDKHVPYECGTGRTSPTIARESLARCYHPASNRGGPP